LRVTESKRKLLESLAIDREEPEETAKGGNRWILLLVAGSAVIAATVIGFYVWVLPRLTASESTVTSASTATVASAPGAAAPPPAHGAVLSGSGYVVARRQATISAEIIGQISEVLVEEGMRVQAGQVVARLDSRLVRIDLASQEASARSAEAIAADAERDLKRKRGLVKGDVVSEAQLSEAEAKAVSLRAQADLAKQQAERQRALLEKHEIRAPFAGVVTTKDAQPGEIISPSAAGGGFTRTGICTIVDMDSLEIEVDVNEAFISRVSAGQRVIAALDAYPDWEIPASVIAIIPTADRSRATVKVRIKIETQDPRILPEMAAKVQFMDPKESTASEGPSK
jgi:RND family efflux transporter MFP subunit